MISRHTCSTNEEIEAREECSYLQGKLDTLCELKNYENTNTHRGHLVEYLLEEYITDEQAEIISTLITVCSNGMANNRELAKIAGITGTFDTATPIDHVRSVQEAYPNFNTRFMVYDYSVNTFGQFNNVAEALVQRLITVFNGH